MVKIADLPSFDMAEELRTEEDMTVYLNLVLEEDDPAEGCRNHSRGPV